MKHLFTYNMIWLSSRINRQTKFILGGIMSRTGDNIYKRKDGRWEARYIKGYTLQGKIKYGYCYAKTYREVKEKLFILKSSANQNSDQSRSIKTKFSDICDEWLKIKTKKIKVSTLTKYSTAINNHIKPILGGYMICNLNTRVISDFSDYLLIDKGLSAKTVKDILTLLKSIVSYLSKDIPKLKNIEFVYPKENMSEIRVMSFTEEKKFIEFLFLDLDRCKLGILLSLFTGLRIGEICALRWKDISLQEKTLVVRSTMQRLKKFDNGNQKTQVIINSPKSSTSFRLVPLSDMALNVCEKLSCNTPEAFILSGATQKYVEPRVLQYRIKKYSQECGIANLHFHVLRHTFATRCVEVGFEVKSLSEILGHSSPRVTLERYIHPSLQLKIDNINKLSAIGL